MRELKCADLNGESFGGGYLGGRSSGAPTTEKPYIADDVNRAISDLRLRMREKINLEVD